MLTRIGQSIHSGILLLITQKENLQATSIACVNAITQRKQL